MDGQLRDFTTHFEDLLVRVPPRGDDRVVRQWQAPSLEILLQQRLRILVRRARVDFLESVMEKRPYHRVRGIEAAIQEGRANDGLEGIGKHGGAARATTFELALAEPQICAQAGGLGDGGVPQGL